MEEAALFVFRLAAHVDAERAVEPLVGFRNNHAEECVAAVQVAGVVDELFGHGVGCGAHGKRKQRFIRMQARVVRVQGIFLQLANGLDDLVRNDEQVFVNARNALGCR